jgi:putative chitinase
MQLTAPQLAACTGADAAHAARWLPQIQAAFDRFEINTPKAAAAALANIGHESTNLRVVEENLNYSADGLLRTFPTHFMVAEAAQYAHQPERIANRVYANRYGNGDEASGDGWAHRGAGLIQITFAENQRECGTDLGIAPADIGTWLRTDEGAALSAAWFFVRHGCMTPAAAGDFDEVCDLVNIGHKTQKVGDSNGYSARFALWKNGRTALGAA